MARLVLKATDHVIGGVSDAVQLVMYGDYECPYSLRGFVHAHELKQQHGPRLEVAFRHFPLEHKHPRALMAAVAAEAAHRQDHYWQMHATLFGNQRALLDSDLRRYAADLGLDQARFVADLGDPGLRALVRAQHAEGLSLGVDSTPTFFVDGERYDGPVEGIRARVEAALGGGEPAGAR